MTLYSLIHERFTGVRRYIRVIKLPSRTSFILWVMSTKGIFSGIKKVTKVGGIK